MVFTVIEDPIAEISQMVLEGVERRQISVSRKAQAYVAGILVTFILADDVFTAREKLVVDSDSGRYLKPFTFQMQEAAEKPYLFKEIGDRCLYVLGFHYDSIRKHGSAQVHYHSNIGRTAYERYAHILGQHQDNLVRSDKADPLFSELADSFDGLATVVGDLHLKQLDDERTLLAVYNKFVQTGDKRYAELLRAKGFSSQVESNFS